MQKVKDLGAYALIVLFLLAIGIVGSDELQTRQASTAWKQSHGRNATHYNGTMQPRGFSIRGRR